MIKSKYKIASAIILIISTGAFIVGFIQTNYLQKITDLKAEIHDLETDHDRMESKALSQRYADKDYFHRSLDYTTEAKIKDYEFEQLNDTLTNDERKVYVYTISTLMQQSINYRGATSIISIYRHFNHSTNDLIVSTEEIIGYDYRITWEIWQSFLSFYGPPVYEMNASEAYGDFFSYDYIQSRPLVERPRDLKTNDEIFFKINQTGGWTFINITDYFLLSPVISLQDKINSNLIELDKLEAEASIMAFGVTFTTVAVVISGVMANRISDKKLERQFEELKEERLRKKERDLISIPLLIIAAILCILGLIMPYILISFGI
ncbi:MAG: hypothetical protein ACFE9C_13705 [Candidatus Hodarchaeota archaeon]